MADTAGGPLRVLVIDDCPDTAESFAILLGMWGHEVRTVPDGPAALALTEAYRPEVVLLDLGMPGMDGFQVARALRAAPAAASARLVCLTGHTQEEDRRRAIAAGCDDFLVKPPDLLALERLLAASRLAARGDRPCHPGLRDVEAGCRNED